MHVLYEIRLNDVQQRAQNVNTEENPSGWRPFHTFIAYLREKCAKNEGFQGNLYIFFFILRYVPDSQILSVIKQSWVLSE